MQAKKLTRREEENKITKINFDTLSKEVVDCAFKIHQQMGSGLLESIYEDCFVIELNKRDIPFIRQKNIQVSYDDQIIPSTFRLDLVIDDKIIVELKSVEKVSNAHTAQILTYMRTADIDVGLLINFGEPYFKKAVKRFVL